MKRILSLLLVAALVLSIPVMPVFAQTTTAQEENVTPMTDECPCGCGEKLEDVDWQPLPSNIKGSIPEGHHYLAEDFVQGIYGMNIIAGTKVVIDLRGHTWTSTGTENRILTVQGDMWLMDTVGGGKLAPKLKAVYGGAILVDAYEVANPSFTLVSGTITAAEGSGLPGGAGFIYAWEDSKFIMTGGVVENIHAGSYGGAIMAGGTASIEILGGVIRNCSTGIRGGAVYSASSTPVVVKNTTFINNTVNVNTDAKNGGGAIFSVPKLTVENCTFMNNSSTANGGALFAGAGLTVKNSTFIGNSANNGGDIHVAGTAASTIDGCKFYGGYSTLNGGSIMASAANLTITNTEMVGAIADKQGGHIYQTGGNLTIENSTLNGGISNWEGSIYCGGGNLFALSSAVTTITDSTIRNGFAKVYGGNIAMAATTLTLNNSTVTGGVAKYRGNNIGAQSASTVTINGGTIDGDIYIPAGKPITLKGKVNIGLRNNGLAVGGNAGIDASGLTAGSEIYISGTGDLVAAGADLSYFRGAIRTTLAGGGDAAITGTAGTTGYCPHCGQIVTWSAYADELTGGHYYMAESVDANTNYSYTGGADVVIDLNGKTISDTSSRAFTTSITGGATKLSILDSAGNGLVQSWGPGATYNGGVIFTNGVLNIYGGTFVNRGGTYAKMGGVIYNNGTTNIYGGFFDASKFSNTADTGFGGTICVVAGKTLKVTAGHFVGGTTYNGGNIYAGGGANVGITGGTFVNGTATNSSGNIYLYDGTAGIVEVSNAVIRGGKATVNAGNMHPGGGATNTFQSCYIADGKVTGNGSYGGNISVGATNAIFKDCVIYGGESASLGGNVYTAGLSGALTLDGCLITGGTAVNNGGNIMFNHGTHQILGGEISYGTARIGANIYSNAGNHASGSTNKITIKKNSAGEVPLIFNGYAKPSTTAESYGGNITVLGVVELLDAIIFGGYASDAGNDIQLATGNVRTQLTVGDGVTNGATGAISMSSATGEGVYGTVLPNTVCNGLNENVTIVLEGDYGKPHILAKDGVLKVAGAKALDANGDEVWYADYSEAAADIGTNGIVKLYADAELNLTKDAYVDLNGHTATVSGTGKLLGLDTTGDDYSEPDGKVTFTGTSPVADKSIVYAPNGNKYVALVEDNAVTYHRLGADLTTVTINIDKNAVYFKGKFGADSKLKSLIDTYGIAVSLSGMPDGQLTDSQKSSYQGADLVNGETASGVYVTNILRSDLTAEQNNNRGRDKIYATAYVTLTGGTTFTSDQSSTDSDDIAWSLYDAFTRLDELIDEDPTIFRRHTNDMRAYYAKWKDLGIKDWIREDTNFVQPEKDDVIDVLMIGSSSCYYYVEEMASLAAAAGIKMRVCNVYYSGCPIDKYYEDWKNNYADYQFFDTTAEVLSDGTIKATRKALGGGKTLEWCLAQGDWDVISMQSRGATVMRDYLKGVDHLEASDIKEASEFMLPYVKSQFPDAHFYLREQAAYQVGKVLTVGGGLPAYKFENLEDQVLYAAAQKDASDRMVAKFNAEPYNLNMGIMRDAEAGMFVRQGFPKADGSGMWEPYDQLCARIGFRPGGSDVSYAPDDPHEGDHGHAGDIGGGQYMEGAQWLQSIIQNNYSDLYPNFDVREIDWVPTYTYKEEVVPNRFDPQQLREAAYKAAQGEWQLPADFVSPVQ